MKRVISALLAAVFALASISAMACDASKAQDGKQMSSPAKPKT